MKKNLHDTHRSGARLALCSFALFLGLTIFLHSPSAAHAYTTYPSYNTCGNASYIYVDASCNQNAGYYMYYNQPQPAVVPPNYYSPTAGSYPAQYNYYAGYTSTVTQPVPIQQPLYYQYTYTNTTEASVGYQYPNSMYYGQAQSATVYNANTYYGQQNGNAYNPNSYYVQQYNAGTAYGGQVPVPPRRHWWW